MDERFKSVALDQRAVDWYSLVTTPRLGSATLGKAVKLVAWVVIALVALNLYAPGSSTITERAFASAILVSLAVPVWSRITTLMPVSRRGRELIQLGRGCPR